MTTPKLKDKIKYPKRLLKLADVSCGTTACAVGFAAVSGMFAKQGLGHSLHGRFIDVTFGDEYLAGVEAAEHLFGSSNIDAIYLFTISGALPAYKKAAGERAVAKRLRDYVAGKIAGPAVTGETAYRAKRMYGYFPAIRAKRAKLRRAKRAKLRRANA